jgi:co-chaperonin GroES (HSP10)
MEVLRWNACYGRKQLGRILRPRHAYLIEPVGGEYRNTKSLAGSDIVVNTSIEDAKYVNRLGVVLEVPINHRENIKVGDLVIVHHNVFRTHLNMRGTKTKSNEFFRANTYLVTTDRIFLYGSHKKWSTVNDFCFIRPSLKDQDRSYTQVEKLQENTGTVYFGNETLTSADILVGDKVGFTRNSEYEFEIDGESLYRMQNRDICLTITRTR